MDTSTTCEFCKDKKGLAIMPVRYTAAPIATGAPKIVAPMKVTDFSVEDEKGEKDKKGGKDKKAEKLIPLKGGLVDYTTRLIRAGYLYVYDEARDRWEGYYVTPDAYFLPFDITKPMPTNLVDKKPCNGSGHAQVVSMISIRDPKNASTVWFGYSEMEWTPAVLKRHSEASYRKRHMQALNVKDLLTGKAQPHTHPIAKLGSVVSEFHLDPDKRKSDIFLTQNPIRHNLRKPQTGQTIAEADWMYKGKGVILALNDPAGVAVELAAIMSMELAWRTEALEACNKKYLDLKRKVAVASAIAQLRPAVQKQAEDDCIDSAPSTSAMVAATAGWGTYFDEQLLKDVEDIRKVDAAQLAAARKGAWRKYTHRQSGEMRFDEQGANAFYQDYQKDLEKITTNYIDPLGECHVAWASSARMSNYLSCNFDPADMRSGAAYLESVLQFTKGTEGVKACFKQYEKWLDGKEFKPENILLRALVYNNDNLAKQVNDATAFDPRAIPWDNLQSAIKGALEKVGNGHTDRMAVFLARMTGPMGKALNATIDGGIRQVATVVGAFSGGWKRVELSGSRKEFRAFLTRMFIESSDFKLNKAQVKLAVDREIKRAEIKGEKLTPQHKTKWLVCIDPAAAKSGKPVLANPGTLDDIRFHKFKEVAGPSARMAVCVSLLQYYCLTKTIADYGKSLEADQPEALSRLVAGSMGLAGGIIELAGDVIEKAANVKMSWAQGISENTISKLKFWGKAIGFVGAIIMAGWDVWKAWEEGGKENYLTAGLYVGSAVLGITAAYMLTFCVFNPFTLLVIVAFIAVAYFLETIKDNALQSWLENCIFGRGNTYTSGEKEMEEFKKAIS